jgi:hypothetical protein|tara:strand:+ start:59 stop:292 length:234 start_codon:yes stop_codon:yes gene_type:complete
MKVRVVDKNYIELERSEIIVELTVITKFWLWDITKVYRKVHGEYFSYKDGLYKTLSKRKQEDVAKWFKLPEDSIYKS